MDDAGLEHRQRKRGLNRLSEPGKAVGAEYQDVLHAAVLELVEDGQPELRAFGIREPQTEDVFVTIDPDADDEISEDYAMTLDNPDDHKFKLVVEATHSRTPGGAPIAQVVKLNSSDPQIAESPEITPSSGSSQTVDLSIRPDNNAGAFNIIHAG